MEDLKKYLNKAFPTAVISFIILVMILTYVTNIYGMALCYLIGGVSALIYSKILDEL